MTRRRQRTGRFGERLAVTYLRLRGYRILARNLRTPLAEIDILARQREHLVVVEVKTRHGQFLDDGISLAQRRRLARAAGWVHSRRGGDGGVRVDLIKVELPSRGRIGVPRLRHLKAIVGSE